MSDSALPASPDPPASFARHASLLAVSAGAAALLIGSALTAYYAWILDDTPETVLAWYGHMGKREVVLGFADGSLGVCTITGEPIKRAGSRWMPPSRPTTILWAHTSRGPRVVIALQNSGYCSLYEWAYTNAAPPRHVAEIRPFGELAGLAFAELDSRVVLSTVEATGSRLVVFDAESMSEPPREIELPVRIGPGPPLLRRTSEGWAAVVTRADDSTPILCEGDRATPVTTNWIRSDAESPLTIATFFFAPDGVVISSRDIFHTPLIPWPDGKRGHGWVPIYFTEQARFLVVQDPDTPDPNRPHLAGALLALDCADRRVRGVPYPDGAR